MAPARFAAVLLVGALAFCARAQGPEAVDVHVLELSSSPEQFVSTARIVLSKRLVASGSAAERDVAVQAGGSKIGVAISRGPDGTLMIQRHAGGFRNSSQTSNPDPTIDLTDPFRWGRAPRHGSLVRAALLCEPVADASRPFAPLDPRGFAQHVAEFLFANPPKLRVPTNNEIRIEIGGKTTIHSMHVDVDDWSSSPVTAAKFLGSLPLREYLEPGQVDRILEGGTKIAGTLGDTESPLARPLLALGYRPLLAHLAEAGSRPGNHGERTVRPPWVPRSYEDAVLVAFATVPDPEVRGLAGWLAAGTRIVAVYEALTADVRAGRAVLPGDEADQAHETEYLGIASAWQSTTAPLLTLAGTAAAIAAIMLLLRFVLRRAA